MTPAESPAGPPGAPQVRAATPADARQIAAWQLAMAWETERLPLEEATVIAGVDRVFAEPHRGRYWIAEADGRPAGCALTIEEWSDWRNGAVLWVHSVYVEPAARRRGVFRALYGHLRQAVESDPGLRGLRLYVDRTNADAQRVYRALGMNDEHYALFEWMKA